MPLDKFIKLAKTLLGGQKSSTSEVHKTLQEYDATGAEADRNLKGIQKEERNDFNPKDF